jgi:hypothetical protein
VGNQDERDRSADEREAAGEDVEAHSLGGDNLAGDERERSSDETDDVEAHSLGGDNLAGDNLAGD